MRKRLSLVWLGLLLAIALLANEGVGAAPSAQGTIALKNAGFEEGTTNGWSWWSKPEQVNRDDPNDSWYTPMYVPNKTPKRVHSGNQSIEINNEYRRWRGGVYQSVSATPGTKLVFKIWVQGYINPEGTPMQARVGIDPEGGGNVGAGSIAWSGTAGVGESYILLATPEVTVGAGGKVTVFAWAEAPYPATKSAIFFDDASLEITGQSSATSAPTKAPGGSPPKPTTAPVAAQPVKPAQPQADGSIVYTVQPGDTLFAIALAHDTTVDNIMQLNGLSNTILSVGQRLIIRGPTVAPTAAPPPTAAAPPTAPPTPAPPTGQICIQAYNDRDGNGQPGGVGEDLLPGVVFALSTAQGALKNYTTDGANEPYCFTDLLPDTYTVKILPPTGYSATTPEVWSLGVAGGQIVDVNFGARRGGALPTITPTSQPASSGDSGSLLVNAGRFVIGAVAAIVLIGLGATAMYFVSSLRR